MGKAVELKSGGCFPRYLLPIVTVRECIESPEARNQSQINGFRNEGSAVSGCACLDKEQRNQGHDWTGMMDHRLVPRSFCRAHSVVSRLIALSEFFVGTSSDTTFQQPLRKHALPKKHSTRRTFVTSQTISSSMKARIVTSWGPCTSTSTLPNDIANVTTDVTGATTREITSDGGNEKN